MSERDKKKEEILLEGKTDCLEGFGDMTLDCLDRQVHARRDLCIGHTVRPAFLEHFPAFGRQGSHGLPYYPGCILRIDPVMLIIQQAAAGITAGSSTDKKVYKNRRFF